APPASTSEMSPSIANRTSAPTPRGGTGGGGTAAGPPPNLADDATCEPAGRAGISWHAASSAATASTVPNPVPRVYPPRAPLCAVVVSACSTGAGDNGGSFDAISATTPATSAQAGLVPSTVQYMPSRPWAGTFTPGAATFTDRLLLEKPAALPWESSAPTLSTPGYSAGKETGASWRWSSWPELPDDAISTAPCAAAYCSPARPAPLGAE